MSNFFIKATESKGLFKKDFIYHVINGRVMVPMSSESYSCFPKRSFLQNMDDVDKYFDAVVEGSGNTSTISGSYGASIKFELVETPIFGENGLVTNNEIEKLKLSSGEEIDVIKGTMLSVESYYKILNGDMAFVTPYSPNNSEAQIYAKAIIDILKLDLPNMAIQNTGHLYEENVFGATYQEGRPLNGRTYKLVPNGDKNKRIIQYFGEANCRNLSESAGNKHKLPVTSFFSNPYFLEDAETCMLDRTKSYTFVDDTISVPINTCYSDYSHRIASKIVPNVSFYTCKPLNPVDYRTADGSVNLLPPFKVMGIASARIGSNVGFVLKTANNVNFIAEPWMLKECEETNILSVDKLVDAVQIPLSNYKNYYWFANGTTPTSPSDLRQMVSRLSSGTDCTLITNIKDSIDLSQCHFATGIGSIVIKNIRIQKYVKGVHFGSISVTGLLLSNGSIRLKGFCTIGEDWLKLSDCVQDLVNESQEHPEFKVATIPVTFINGKCYLKENDVAGISNSIPLPTIDPDLRVCNNCFNFGLASGFGELDGQMVCSTCASRATTCGICGAITLSASRGLLSPNNEICVCRNCRNTRVNICNDCGHIEVTEEGRPHQRDNGHRCSSCQERYDLRRFSEIYSYSYKPAPIFFASSDDSVNPTDPLSTTPSFFGVELEVDYGNDRDTAVGYSHTEFKNEKLIYVKSDGSLDRGFEIVTHPMTYGFIDSVKGRFGTLFDKLMNLKWKSHDTTTCGMHVHTSTKMWGDNPDDVDSAVAKAYVMINKNYDFVLKFTRRTSSNLERWSNMLRSINYSVPADKEALKTRERRIKDDVKNSLSDRYVAINVRNRYTIEFRIFRGTLCLETFMANIQFCKLLVEFVKNHPLDDCVNTPLVDVLKGKYVEMDKYLIRKGFISSSTLELNSIQSEDI